MTSELQTLTENIYQSVINSKKKFTAISVDFGFKSDPNEITFNRICEVIEKFAPNVNRLLFHSCPDPSVFLEKLPKNNLKEFFI